MSTPPDTGVRAPWTNVYGMARTLLAIGTLITLVVNDLSILFPASELRAEQTGMFLAGRMSLFVLVPPAYLELARWLAVAVLLIVLSGWRPRITGVLHWWVAFSFAASSGAVDGGDHITAVLTLLLLPLTLTDPRRNHWDPAPRLDSGVREGVAIVAGTTLTVIRLQIALIYFQAGVAKMAVEEWKNGTALYYWVTHQVFGLAPEVQAFVVPVLANAWVVTLLTWGVIAFEVLLFTALVMDRKWWPPLLLAGLGFHFMIILLHGLLSFFFATAGALVLYLRPADAPFAGVTVWHSLRARLPIRRVRPPGARAALAE